MLDVTEEDLESVTIFHLFDLTCVPHQCVKNAISYGKKDQLQGGMCVRDTRPLSLFFKSIK